MSSRFTEPRIIQCMNSYNKASFTWVFSETKPTSSAYRHAHLEFTTLSLSGVQVFLAFRRVNGLLGYTNLKFMKQDKLVRFWNMLKTVRGTMETGRRPDLYRRSITSWTVDAVSIQIGAPRIVICIIYFRLDTMYELSVPAVGVRWFNQLVDNVMKPRLRDFIREDSEFDYAGFHFAHERFHFEFHIAKLKRFDPVNFQNIRRIPFPI